PVAEHQPVEQQREHDGTGDGQRRHLPVLACQDDTDQQRDGAQRDHQQPRADADRLQLPGCVGVVHCGPIDTSGAITCSTMSALKWPSIAISMPRFQYSQPNTRPPMALSSTVRTITIEDRPQSFSAAGRWPAPKAMAAI